MINEQILQRVRSGSATSNEQRTTKKSYASSQTSCSFIMFLTVQSKSCLQ